jgi:hypothetical protein
MMLNFVENLLENERDPRSGPMNDQDHSLFWSLWLLTFSVKFSIIDKIRTYRTQTPYTFFGHKAFTAISYPGEGAKSQPTG